MAQAKKNGNGHKKRLRKNGEVDLRTLPAGERPKPSSGQSREEFALATSDLKKHEVRLLGVLNGEAKGLREAYPISLISKSTRMTLLEVRNTIRRLVPSTWVERVDEVIDDAGEVRQVRGYYRITERGRKRLASAQA